MSSPRQNEVHDDALRQAEETLRLIATMPPPDGMVDRVQARVRTAPRTSTVLHWPMTLTLGGWMYSPALRGAAAAAIVCLVVGGGWQIYSHVQPAPTAQVIVMPGRMGNSGAFSSAGAMRTPDTLKGPVLADPRLAHPAIPAQQDVIAPMPSPEPHAVARQPRPATHKKKPVPGGVR